MKGGIAIPQDVLERALGWAIQQRLESTDLESMKLLNARKAAEMVGVPPRVFRRLAKDHIDLGAKSTRWSLKDLRALIESRRVKSRS